jgi:hypothetical protein
MSLSTNAERSIFLSFFVLTPCREELTELWLPRARTDDASPGGPVVLLWDIPMKVISGLWFCNGSQVERHRMIGVFTPCDFAVFDRSDADGLSDACSGVEY